MKICGLTKTTLLDYPGRVACTIFLGGCNFRCPFCHNSSLVLESSIQPTYTSDEILKFLQKRKGILDGVCISGGEPTLQVHLADFLLQIKELGYAVKLDTNGTQPEVLCRLLQDHLVDKIAMDIKTSPEKYPLLCGISSPDMSAVNESVKLIMQEAPDYEFRTTVVKELHTREDFEQIGQWLSGARAYYLQAYKDSESVLQPGFHSFSKEELEEFRKLLSASISLIEIRGIN